VPPTLQRAWLTNSLDVNAQNVTRFRASYAKLLELTRRMHEEGVPFVAGTDNIAGFTLHRELEIYAQAGISPAEALQIATRNGARYTQLFRSRGIYRRRQGCGLSPGGRRSDAGHFRDSRHQHGHEGGVTY